jgi:hypothetical protein
MNASTTNTSNSIKTMISSLSDLKDSTMILVLSVGIMVIILITIAYYLYYTGSIFTDPLIKRECDRMNTIYGGELNGNIRSIDTTSKNYDHTLRDYYIKTAYNACSGGSYRIDYVDTCPLKNVLKLGCRGLDFEIFSINDQPVVATSTSESYYIKETFNYVPFADVMNIIRNFAFSSSTAPNFQDPIILHLRIKSSNITMYDNFAKLLEGYNDILLGKQYSYEYQGKNLGSVPLKDFMNKNNVIIIVEKRDDNPFMESKVFHEYVNMTSNSTFMRSLHYYDVQYANDIDELTEYNKLCMTIGMPDKGSNPQNPSSVYMRETGCQLLGMRYQYNDTNLEENEMFFDENGFAFVLKPERLRYIPQIVDDPTPQDPKLSYATREVKSEFYNFEI